MTPQTDTPIHVTGAGGRLGSCLIRNGCLPLECDLRFESSVSRAVREAEPSVIINCAAYTAVDACEDPANQDEAIAVNMSGVGYLRSHFRGYMIHVSTGYVFDGTEGPYAEEAEPKPVNFYGMTKLGGEAAMAILPSNSLIVRTLDLFGPNTSTDFVKQVRGVLQSGKSMALPNNLYGTPTYIPHLAEAILACVARGLTGIIHLGGALSLTRQEWGRMIAEAFGHDPALIHGTSRITGKAPRPRNASLDTGKAVGLGLPIHSPRDGLEDILRREHAAPAAP